MWKKESAKENKALSYKHMMCKVVCITKKRKIPSSNTVGKKSDLIFQYSVVLSEMWMKWMEYYVPYPGN